MMGLWFVARGFKVHRVVEHLYVCCPGASSWFFGSIQFPSVYSNPSSPGLLVGSGNVGGDGAGLDDNDG